MAKTITDQDGNIFPLNAKFRKNSVAEWRCFFKGRNGYNHPIKYYVSQHGQVKSVTTKGEEEKEKLYSLTPGSSGYVTVSLRYENDDEPMSRSVHRIVARYFLGHPRNKEVHHKDRNRSNNFVGNLEYRTHDQNLAERMYWGKATFCPNCHVRIDLDRVRVFNNKFAPR